MGLKGSAYVSGDKAKLVVVFVNHGESNEKVNLTGVDDYGRFKVYLTDEDHDLAYAGETGAALFVPKRAVVTLVADKGAEFPSNVQGMNQKDGLASSESLN